MLGAPMEGGPAGSVSEQREEEWTAFELSPRKQKIQLNQQIVSK